MADLKRLNKIERELEIHARKTIKVPLTVDTVLIAEHLPIVHKSGQNSPKHNNHNVNGRSTHSAELPNSYLNEKLLVAAVSLSSPTPTTSATASNTPSEPSINDIILKSKIARNHYTDLEEENDRNGKHLVKKN